MFLNIYFFLIKKILSSLLSISCALYSLNLSKFLIVKNVFLNLFGLHCLIILKTRQVYKSRAHRLCVTRCAHHPRSRLLPRPCPRPPSPFSATPACFPSADHMPLLVSMGFLSVRYICLFLAFLPPTSKKLYGSCIFPVDIQIFYIINYVQNTRY